MVRSGLGSSLQHLWKNPGQTGDRGDWCVWKWLPDGSDRVSGWRYWEESGCVWRLIPAATQSCLGEEEVSLSLSSWVILSFSDLIHSSGPLPSFSGPFMPGTSLFFPIFLYPWRPFNTTTVPINTVKYHTGCTPPVVHQLEPSKTREHRQKNTADLSKIASKVRNKNVSEFMYASFMARKILLETLCSLGPLTLHNCWSLSLFLSNGCHFSYPTWV